MIGPLVFCDLSARDQFAANQIDAIQRSALRIEPKDCDPEFIGPCTRFGIHAMTGEDQTTTTVKVNDHSRALDELNLQIPSPVLDPAEMAGPVQIADLTRFTRCHDRVSCAQMMHPLPAELDRFVVRGSPRSWFRRLSHRSRVHPSADGRSTWPRFSTRVRLVGGEG